METLFLKFDFHRFPFDLAITLLLATILVPTALLGLQGPVRVAFGLAFVLACPGYTLVAALFPRASDLDWIERLALSFGLSIAVVPLIGLLLNFTPFGIRLEPVLVSLYLFTVGLAALAWHRRSQLPLEERLSLSIELKLPDWKSYSRTDKLLTLALIASLLFAAGSVGYVVVTPRPAEKFTEFYMLNATGVAGGYPTNLTVGQNGTLNLTVHNREFAPLRYELRIYQATMEEVFNASANRTELRELSRSFLSNLTIELASDAYWNQSYTFNLSSPGIFRLYFLLYKLPDDQTVYRTLYLTVRVRAS